MQAQERLLSTLQLASRVSAAATSKVPQPEDEMVHSMLPWLVQLAPPAVSAHMLATALRNAPENVLECPELLKAASGRPDGELLLRMLLYCKTKQLRIELCRGLDMTQVIRVGRFVAQNIQT